jgi:hypothetical protein
MTMRSALVNAIRHVPRTWQPQPSGFGGLFFSRPRDHHTVAVLPECCGLSAEGSS